jgi:hypothetical protein
VFNFKVIDKIIYRTLLELYFAVLECLFIFKNGSKKLIDKKFEILVSLTFDFGGT